MAKIIGRAKTMVDNWYAGKVLDCQSCQTRFELEKSDVVVDLRSKPTEPNYATLCPFCNKQVRFWR